MPSYIPTKNGRTYYTFRVGCVWGLLLDCGEDKDDSHEEYGGTVCFHTFRLRETAYIRQVIAHAQQEYEAEGVKHKLVICHIGFTHVDPPPFNIEREIYTEWSRLLREHIKPDLMLYGHHHVVKISPVGSEFDDLGQPCTAIVGSRPIIQRDSDVRGFIGCGVTLKENGEKRVVFNDHAGNVLQDETVR